MKFNSETKYIAIGVALNNFTLGLVIGIVIAIGLIKKNKTSKNN